MTKRPILIDPRAGSGDLLATLAAAFPEHDVRHASLEFGDVAWLGNGPDGPIWVGAELKRTLSDIIHSVESGRLFGEQVHGLLRRYETGYLIVGADPDDEPHAGTWDRSAILGACETFRALTGWQALWCPVGDVEVVDNLIGRIAWWMRPWKHHRSHLAIKEPMLENPGAATTTERMIAQIPLVGPTRARAIADSFPTVALVVAAGIEGLKTVDGVGEKVAASVIHELTRTE